VGWSIGGGKEGEAGTFAGLHWGAGVGSGAFQGVPFLSGADVIGDAMFGSGSLSKDEWRLVFADEIPEFQVGGNQMFVFNGYGPISMRQAWEENVAVVSTFAPEPSVMTTPGQPMRIDVEGFFPAQHSMHDVTDIIDRLEMMRRFDPTLGRKPRITFDWGGVYVTGYLTSLSIDYNDTKFFVTGSHTGFTVSFSLVSERVLKPMMVDVTTGEIETKLVTLGEYETFEWLAYKELGDPKKGFHLRFYNEHVTDDEFGTQVKVFGKGHSLNVGAPKMRSYVFAGEWESDFQTYASGLEGGYGDWNSIPSEYTA